MGNSEVGHLNIGAGRVVYMDITKIDLMIENGEFFTNLALMKAMESGANSPPPGKRWFIRSSFERPKKSYRQQSQRLC